MDKYLSRYAEPEIAALADMPEQGVWHHVMVVPACNEGPGILRVPPPSDGRSLLILVINEPPGASEEVSANNKALATAVFDRFELQWQSASTFEGFSLSLLRGHSNERDVLLIDRFSEGCELPEKGGVGQARKIGVDLACALFNNGRLLSPWIHCTDADVWLPDTYFTASNEIANAAAKSVLIYPFSHSDDVQKSEDQGVILATQLYELSLRYYVAGMKFAGSPYAFHTIGSTMAVNAPHYAKVRGFPRREAGEDFYLLNKLAKVGDVLELEQGLACEPIEIKSRRSDRVPFGTGAAVNKISGFGDSVREYRFYDPVVFQLLKDWLLALPVIWESRSREIGNCIQPMVNKNQQQVELVQVLDDLGMSKALDHAFRQSKSQHQFILQMSTWFDAFRTLKLIHGLRDRCACSISYATLEKQPLFLHLLAIDPDLQAFYERLSHKISSN